MPLPARLVCIPRWDLEFVMVVEGIAANGPTMTTGALEDLLRPHYPGVSVHERGLNGEPFATWYVNRDGGHTSISSVRPR